MSRNGELLECHWNGERTKDDKLICAFCKIPFALRNTDPENTHRNCPKHPEILKVAKEAEIILGEPGLVERGYHYAKALVKWSVHLWPRRSAEEAENLERICQSCPGGHYDAQAEECKVCGCGTSSQRWAIRSKVKMQTEDCPKGFWPKKSSTSDGLGLSGEDAGMLDGGAPIA